MNVRRSAAVLAATAVIGAAGPAVAADPSPSPSVAIPTGLYGRTDPTYDGVWRQSLALLAQDSVGVRPASSGIAWLIGQQCANGAFAAFRADTAKACDAGLMVDTNSTAAAVQALAALGGHGAVTEKSVAWLKSVQNADGGWGYSPGGASDANSTSVVIGALTATGEKPQDIRKGGKSPYDALLKFALPCDSDSDQSGAFAYQPDKKGDLTANADATAAAVVAALGKGLAGTAPKAAETDLTCKDASADPGQAARNGAAYLVEALAKDGHLTSALPGAEDQPDYGNTADAVVALATAGQVKATVPAVRWLQANSVKWAQQSGPAAYAQLILAANASAQDPRDFGGQDLVKLLDATGPGPVFVPDAESTSPGGSGDAAAADDDSGNIVWIAGGGLLLVVVAVGYLLFVRGRKRRS
ncbi:prenyltransferase/squalene oxidase repeat-containing protein [Streptomyces sp. NPDC001315]|uniref:prenyltransferase/squalene oxidase repeat-containing protein n=1 Tax=Streptomyces sp. NPDC001315 TaxID=3364562 RepID=UPI00368D3B26